MAADHIVLDELRAEIRPLASGVKTIQPRQTTSVSLVAADGGNNRIEFDPFMVQLVRVVDSSANEYCLEAITPTTNVDALSARQFHPDGSPATALGYLLKYLGLKSLPDLSPMIPKPKPGEPVSPSWVQVYRELVEWAVLFKIIRTKDFATDTLIVVDGLLRSKVFAGTLFPQMLDGIWEGILEHKKRRRNVWLAGVAKTSKVLSRYRLAMALEGVLTCTHPAYVEVPADIEAKAYLWGEFARGNEQAAAGGEANKFVGGRMFFVKFGPGARDPIWPVDVFDRQKESHQIIFGCMLNDATNGFPVPFYPMCLQRAHENAALVDFDMDILQNEIFEGIRLMLKERSQILDTFRLMDADPSSRRY